MQHRSLQKEQLDDLTLNGQKLSRTLSELSMINRFFGNYRAIRKAVFEVIRLHPSQSIHIIDIGSGSGDVLLFLAKNLRKEGLKASFLGIDGNAHSLDFATKKAVDFPEIEFRKADLLAIDFQLPKCDILISSHFLYHFDNQQVIQFLNRQKSSIKLAIIASELERNQLAFWLFKLFSPLLGFSKLTREDGLLAIRRAFKKQELTMILNNSHFTNFVIKRQLLFRLILKINLQKQTQ